jgi:hypothetical protein
LWSLTYANMASRVEEMAQVLGGQRADLATARDALEAKQLAIAQNVAILEELKVTHGHRGPVRGGEHVEDFDSWAEAITREGELQGEALTLRSQVALLERLVNENMSVQDALSQVQAYMAEELPGDRLPRQIDVAVDEKGAKDWPSVCARMASVYKGFTTVPSEDQLGDFIIVLQSMVHEEDGKELRQRTLWTSVMRKLNEVLGPRPAQEVAPARPASRLPGKPPNKLPDEMVVELFNDMNILVCANSQLLTKIISKMGVLNSAWTDFQLNATYVHYVFAAFKSVIYMQGVWDINEIKQIEAEYEQKPTDVKEIQQEKMHKLQELTKRWDDQQGRYRDLQCLMEAIVRLHRGYDLQSRPQPLGSHQGVKLVDLKIQDFLKVNSHFGEMSLRNFVALTAQVHMVEAMPTAQARKDMRAEINKAVLAMPSAPAASREALRQLTAALDNHRLAEKRPAGDGQQQTPYKQPKFPQLAPSSGISSKIHISSSKAYSFRGAKADFETVNKKLTESNVDRRQLMAALRNLTEKNRKPSATSPSDRRSTSPAKKSGFRGKKSTHKGGAQFKGAQFKGASQGVIRLLKEAQQAYTRPSVDELQSDVEDDDIKRN